MGSFRSLNPVTGELTEFHYSTESSFDNVKIVISNGTSKNNTPIEIAHTSNAIYAIKRKDGKLKSINFFNKDKEKVIQIDLDHNHEGLQPHVHEFHGEKYHPVKSRPMLKAI
jgi:hypothetical protein